MGAFPSRIRVLIAAAGLVAAGAVFLYARFVSEGLPLAAAEGLDGASDALVVVGALYVVNWVVAWIYRFSWPVTLARCLVFAVVAYVGVSHLIDVFGENRDVMWQIVGVDTPVEPVSIGGLRARATCWLCTIGLSALAISVGFEPRSS